MADKHYKLIFELSDGSTRVLEFTSPQGPPGATPVKGVDYFTAEEVQAIAELAAQLASVPGVDLSEYAKKTDIPTVPTKVSAFDNDKGYITEQDLSGYAKESDIPSLDGYAKTEDIPSLDGYAKTEDIPSLDGYAKTEDIPTDAHINDLINTALLESGGGFTKEQINALDGMFKIAVYTEDATAAYEAFKTAFGIDAPHVHRYTSAVITEPTCTTDGVRTYTCSCGDTYTEVIPATGHSYTSQVTTEPTCTKYGVRTYTCSCGDTYTEVIPAIGHSFEDGVCTACGKYADSPYVIAISTSNEHPKFSVGADVSKLNGLSGFAVTAEYSDGNTEVVTDYVASGEVVKGECSIDISYGGLTVSLPVTGVEWGIVEGGSDWTEKTIPVEDIISGVGLGSAPTPLRGFFRDVSNRCSYAKYIPIQPGGTYKFEWEGSTNSIICIEEYTSLAMDGVEKYEEYDQIYLRSSGWQSTNKSGCTFKLQETHNGYPIETIRFTFDTSKGVPTGDVKITKVG